MGWNCVSDVIIHLRCDTAVIIRLHRHFSGSTSTGRHWSTSSSAVRHIASATVRVGTGSCWQYVTSAGRIDGLRWQCVESTVCVGTVSATCVIIIATINYELFVRERFIGDTGNCGLVRWLNVFNAFHCGYKFFRINLIVCILIIVLYFDYCLYICIEFCCSIFVSCLLIINGFVKA